MPIRTIASGRRNVTVAVAVACALLLSACSSASSGTTTTTEGSSTTTSSSSAGSTTSSTVAASTGTTVWLCRPGATNDPCEAPLTTTVIAANGSRSVEHLHDASAPAADCFYVYPTVSTESGQNSNLAIQPAEIAAAVDQASPFSQVCRVWAPMYRQQTAASLAGAGGSITDNVAAENIAYASVLSAWRDYLAHDNDGRPVIFIGHSQGAAMLIRLLRSQIDPVASLRARMVSAIILGGNVQVPTGAAVGGVFQHIPGCTSPSETGCVIAYSSFHVAPPADSLFARPGRGVSLQSGQTGTSGQVLCTNPASLGGGSGALQPFFYAAGQTILGQKVTTPWVSYPGLYTGECTSAGGATWLQIDYNPGDPRPRVKAVLGPLWGLHLDDVNLAVGNLVADVTNEIAAFKG